MTEDARDITVAFAEPDRDMLRLMRGLLMAAGYSVVGFNDADPGDIVACRPDCIVLTLGNSLNESPLQSILEKAPSVPVIAVNTSVEIGIIELVDAGVADFVSKPYRTEELIARITKATRGKQNAVVRPTPPSFTVLTGREHEVLVELAAGASSKEAGRRLGISPRTVDVHRARIKEKLQVRRSVDLVRLVFDSRKVR